MHIIYSRNNNFPFFSEPRPRKEIRKERAAFRRKSTCQRSRSKSCRSSKNNLYLRNASQNQWIDYYRIWSQKCCMLHYTFSSFRLEKFLIQRFQIASLDSMGLVSVTNRSNLDIPKIKCLISLESALKISR